MIAKLLILLTISMTSFNIAAEEVFYAQEINCRGGDFSVSVTLKAIKNRAKNKLFSGKGSFYSEIFTLPNCQNTDFSLECRGKTSSRRKVHLTLTQDRQNFYHGILNLEGGIRTMVNCLIKK